MRRGLTIQRRHAASCLLGVALFVNLQAMAGAAEWPSALNVSTLDGTTGFRIDGVDSNDESGHQMSSAGDVNGDGFDDVLIGAFRADANGSESGEAYVVFGRASGFASALGLFPPLSAADGFQINGVAAGDRFGRATDAAGDVNGDGVDDIIIGAHVADPLGLNGEGASYVIFGKASGLPSLIEASSLNGNNGFRLSGETASDNSGRAVAGVGDVNGDGFDDVAVGAQYADPNGGNSGAVWVVFGKPAAFASDIALSSLNGNNGFQVNGEVAGDFMFTVEGAGDVNGDGVDDMLFGAYSANGGAGNTGLSYVVFGKKAAFGAVLQLSALDGSNGFQINGAAANDYSSRRLSAAGDVNGDGFADVIVGADRSDANGSNSGAAHVVFGKGSSFSSTVEVSALDGSNGFMISGEAPGDRAGRAVAATDVNGDGFSDLLLGAPNADEGLGASGVAYVVFGSGSKFASVVQLSALDGTNGLRIIGALSSDRLGDEVSTGDVNGDGFGDLILAAYGADPGNILVAGSTYVVFGREPDQSVARVGTRAKQVIRGGPFADILVAAGRGDVVEGRQGGDILVGDVSTTASYRHASAGMVLSLGRPFLNTGDGAGDAYVQIPNLEGSSLGDVIAGSNAANILVGGKGKDELKGGGGKDVFGYRFAAESPPGSANADLILDFSPGTASSSVDKIDLSEVDANSGKNGNQAFKFRGTKAFNGAGQVRLKKSGNNVVVQGNTGGSAAPEFEIVLRGMAGRIGKLTARDFNL